VCSLVVMVEIDPGNFSLDESTIESSWSEFLSFRWERAATRSTSALSSMIVQEVAIKANAPSTYITTESLAIIPCILYFLDISWMWSFICTTWMNKAINRAYCNAVKSRSAVVTSMGDKSQSCSLANGLSHKDDEMVALWVFVLLWPDSTRGLNASDSYTNDQSILLHF
jgi:hypothetical protein